MILCRCFDTKAHANMFLDGKLRMMSLEYYRKKENDENGRKDKYEGTKLLWQGENTVIVIDGHEISNADGLVSFVMRSMDHEKNTKICCCSLLPINNNIEVLENLLKFRLPYCVLFTNPNEFVLRFRRAAQNMKYAMGRISFFDEKTYNGDLNAFMKPVSFSWQNEFRLTLEVNTDDPYILNLGDLHDIAVVFETNELVKKLSKVIQL